MYFVIENLLKLSKEAILAKQPVMEIFREYVGIAPKKDLESFEVKLYRVIKAKRLIRKFSPLTERSRLSEAHLFLRDWQWFCSCISLKKLKRPRQLDCLLKL